MSNEDFAAQPAYMSAMQMAQDGAFTGITTAFSVITPAQLSSFATAIGPLGVVNVIPAFFASTGNNVASGLATGVNHALLGASTEVAQAGYVKVDEATGSGMPSAGSSGDESSARDYLNERDSGRDSAGGVSVATSV